MRISTLALRLAYVLALGNGVGVVREVGGFTRSSTTTTARPSLGVVVRQPKVHQQDPRNALISTTTKASITIASSSTSLFLASSPQNKNNNVEDEVDDDVHWYSPITSDPQRSVTFSLLMTICGAILGPFLDSYHSAFGVLQYDNPSIVAVLWGTKEYPALTTTFWVPPLFGLAAFLIGWLYILGDHITILQQQEKEGTTTNSDGDDSDNSPITMSTQLQPVSSSPPSPSPPKILIGIAIFSLQYLLSGLFYSTGKMDRTTLLNVMSFIAAAGFLSLDGSLVGLWTSLATAIGGPLIELALLTFILSDTGNGYHYNDLGETGYFPLWILPVYFLGGPANGNLARGFWNKLSSGGSGGVGDVLGERRIQQQQAQSNQKQQQQEQQSTMKTRAGCKVCNDTRCVGCPNCDAKGLYVTYGEKVTCPACRGRGLVICRSCFDHYGEDPNDIEAIRQLMNKMPD